MPDNKRLDRSNVAVLIPAVNEALRIRGGELERMNLRVGKMQQKE